VKNARENDLPLDRVIWYAGDDRSASIMTPGKTDRLSQFIQLTFDRTPEPASWVRDRLWNGDAA